MIQSLNNQSQFDQEVYQSKQLVICFFWTGFCQACKQMYSIYQSVEARFNDSVRFFSVNLEENPKLGDNAGILVVPTVVLYKSGRTVNRLFGLQTDEDLTHIVEEAIVG